MDPYQAIVDMKAHFDALYDDVRLRGSGRAEVVVINKGLRGATISVASDDKSWFVELWSASNLTMAEDNLIDERVIELREEAINRICSWLDG
jgi:hypothetical protein